MTMRRMRKLAGALHIATAVCAVALIHGCAAAGVTSAQGPANAMTPVPIWPTSVQPLLPALLGDAAQRSAKPVELLRVASVQAVTWPDGSLGCPQPGLLYTQALVPGWRISIDVPGASPLLYHASQRGSWVWCQPERATPAAPGSPEQGT